MEIKFRADRVFLKPLRTDHSFRVELDVGKYEKQEMIKVLILPKGMYKITIEPDVENDKMSHLQEERSKGR